MHKFENLDEALELIAQLQQEKADLEKKISSDEVQARLDEVRAEKESAEARVQELETAQETMKADFDELNRKHETLTAELDEVKTERDGLLTEARNAKRIARLDELNIKASDELREKYLNMTDESFEATLSAIEAYRAENPVVDKKNDSETKAEETDEVETSDEVETEAEEKNKGDEVETKAAETVEASMHNSDDNVRSILASVLNGKRGRK